MNGSNPNSKICPERMFWNLEETTRMIPPFYEYCTLPTRHGPWLDLGPCSDWCH